jgi:hypothetical protein
MIDFTEIIKVKDEMMKIDCLVATPPPDNGAEGMLSIMLKNGFMYPVVIKTGCLVDLDSLSAETKEHYIKNERLVITGVYKGDNQYGVAQIDWVDELKDHSIKIKKSVSLLDKDFWSVLEKLKAVKK